MRLVKFYAKRLANYCGFEIHRRCLYQPRRSMGEALQHLLHLGFYPRTIIDVGVAQGTFDLYRTFPDAFVVLIEPLKEFEDNLKSITKNYRGTYVIAAAASQEGRLDINVHLDHLNGSSLYKETMGIDADGISRQISCIQVDKFLQERRIEGPYLLKIDVQGAELDVLNGCSQALESSELVILEVSMFEFMKDEPQFHDVVSYMKQRAFVAYEILPAWNRPLDNALGQIDMFFVKEFGRFRKDHAYSTSDQRTMLFNS